MANESGNPLNNARSGDSMGVRPKLISVIVPAFNAAHYLERSLPPLIRMRERREIAEVIVVDDCSTDPANVETVRRLGATLVEMPKNGGPGAARNFAAGIAVGEILWLVDADVIAHETGPAYILEAFANPKVGAVFGSYDDAPPAKNFASSYKNLVHRYYHQRGLEESESFWAGCGAIRASVYKAMGGFDGARYGRPSIEDIELGYRIKSAGWQIRLLPDLLGTHLKEWTLGEMVRTDIFQRAAPWSYLILSGRGPSDDLNVTGKERIKAGVAGLWLASLAALLAPPLYPWNIAAALTLTLTVLILSSKLLRFFTRTKGAGFAIRAVAFHQIYYLYSTVTFVVCSLQYHLRGEKLGAAGSVAPADPRVR